MLFGSSSSPTSTVPPVVVSAEIDSNRASANGSEGRSASISGTAPAIPSPAQNITTTTNPSRSFISCRARRSGYHSTSPSSIRMTKPSMNGLTVWS